MREVRIKTPECRALPIVRRLQALGISRVSVQREFVHGPERWQALISTETSTPDAARIVDAVLDSPLFDATETSITVRELRCIVNADSVVQLTEPLEAPRADVEQDLWQFSHVTYGHVARAMVAGSLLAYGLIEGKLLPLLGGLLFLPTLPHLLALGFGLALGFAPGTHGGRLAAQGGVALATTIAIVLGCSALLASVWPGPIRFDGILTPGVSAIISVGVGCAGALASLDDAGKRELIGLATAAQVGLVPAWFGIGLVHGFDAEPGYRLLFFALNLGLTILAAALVYALRCGAQLAKWKRCPIRPLELVKK